MTGGFEASVEELLASGGRLGTAHADIRRSFEPVRFEMDSLFSGGWSGPAAQAFGAGWQEWLQGFRDCLLGLERISAVLGRDAVDYREMDDAAGAAFRRTGGPL